MQSFRLHIVYPRNLDQEVENQWNYCEFKFKMCLKDVNQMALYHGGTCNQAILEHDQLYLQNFETYVSQVRLLESILHYLTWSFGFFKQVKLTISYPKKRDTPWKDQSRAPKKVLTGDLDPKNWFANVRDRL